MRWALLMMICWALWGCHAPLLEGLDEAECNDLVARLTSAGIAARKVGRGARYSVEVPRGAWAAAWQVARRGGWPRPGPARARAGLIPLPDERAAAARAARAEALARTLELDPRVITARVMLGARGATLAVLREPTGPPLRRAALAAQVRAGADLPGDAPVEVAIHQIPAEPVVGPPTRRPLPWAVILASIAVGCMGLACALLWKRQRRRQGRGRGAWSGAQRQRPG